MGWGSNTPSFLWPIWCHQFQYKGGSVFLQVWRCKVLTGNGGWVKHPVIAETDADKNAVIQEGRKMDRVIMGTGVL